MVDVLISIWSVVGGSWSVGGGFVPRQFLIDSIIAQFGGSIFHKILGSQWERTVHIVHT